MLAHKRLLLENQQLRRKNSLNKIGFFTAGTLTGVALSCLTYKLLTPENKDAIHRMMKKFKKEVEEIEDYFEDEVDDLLGEIQDLPQEH